MKAAIVSIIALVLFIAGTATGQSMSGSTVEFGLIQISPEGNTPYEGNLEVASNWLSRWDNEWSLAVLDKKVFKVNQNSKPTMLLPGIEFRITRRQGSSNIAFAERLHWLNIKAEKSNGTNFTIFSRGNAVVFFPDMFNLHGMNALFAYVALGPDALEAQLEVIIPKKILRNPEFAQLDFLSWTDEKYQAKLAAWTYTLVGELIAKEFTTDTASIETVTVTASMVAVVVHDGTTKVVLREGERQVKEILISQNQPWMIRLSPLSAKNKPSNEGSGPYKPFFFKP